MQITKIPYADYVTNPLKAFSMETGEIGWTCQKYSDRCAHCWAERINRRRGTRLNYSKIDMQKSACYLNETEFSLIQTSKLSVHKLDDFYPYVFACDMTDFMLPEYDQWREKLLWEFAIRLDVRWLLLTKRWERLSLLVNSRVMPAGNIFIGLTIPDPRTPDFNLAMTNLFHVYLSGWPVWISNEPALGPVEWPEWAGFISMLVSGGESGPGYRLDNPDWYRSDRDWCMDHHVPFFFKQFAGIRPPEPILDGRTWRQMPRKAEILQDALC